MVCLEGLAEESIFSLKRIGQQSLSVSLAKLQDFLNYVFWTRQD